jgi:hypothetical protein
VLGPRPAASAGALVKNGPGGHRGLKKRAAPLKKEQPAGTIVWVVVAACAAHPEYFTQGPKNLRLIFDGLLVA